MKTSDQSFGMLTPFLARSVAASIHFTIPGKEN